MKYRDKTALRSRGLTISCDKMSENRDPSIRSCRVQRRFPLSVSLVLRVNEGAI